MALSSPWIPATTLAQDTPPSISIEGRTVSEGAAASATFRVVLSAPSQLPVSVKYKTLDGTAKAGQDYVSTAGTLTFTPGRTIHSLFVPILSDATVEGSEQFRVLLESAQNAVIQVGEAEGRIEDPPAAGRAPVYRAYNTATDYHFFTLSRFSRDFAVGTLGYHDESVPLPFLVARTKEAGSVPLFRLYNPNLGRHFYTASLPDRDFLMSIGMVYEGDEGFVFPGASADTTELYRLYNKNSGTHLFTANAKDKAGILALFAGIWEEHTSVGYVFPPPSAAHLLRDINTNDAPWPVNPQQLLQVGQTLYFSAEDEWNGRELWRSDGTRSGTAMVKDIYPGSGSSTPGLFRHADGILYFTASDGFGTAEWRSDGTQAGTYRVTALPSNLSPFGGTGAFSVKSGDLWIDAPTAVQLTDRRSSTSLIVPARQLGPGDIVPFPPYATEADGKIHFGAYHKAGEIGLWNTDGTSAGTSLVTTFTGQTAAATPSRFVRADALAFFRTYPDGLWRTDGSAGGTFQVDAAPSFYAASAGVELGGALLYGAQEPLKSTAGLAGTTIKTLLGEACCFAKAGSKAFFVQKKLSFSPTRVSVYLGVTDGTPAGTVVNLVSDGAYGTENPIKPVAVGSEVFFAHNVADDIELWKSDGTAPGTVRVKDINPGGSSSPDELVDVGGTLFFVANDGVSAGLWKSDGTEAGTLPVKAIVPSRGSAVSHGGRLYFRACVEATGCELWSSDGTAAGTTMVADLWPGADSSFPEQLTSHLGRLYFVAGDPQHGRELWMSDGSAEGTVLLQDINPGSPPSGTLILAMAPSGLLLAADDGVRGREPWFLPIP